MATVYTGKVVIRGDQIEDYFKAREEAENQRAPFKKYLTDLMNEFADELEKKYAKATVRKHVNIVDLFIEFLCRYTDAETIESITRGIVNTHFRKWYKRKVWDRTTERELRVALKKFFTFLADKKNIINEKALLALK